MDIDRAKAISGVAGQLIASAKVEVEFIKATGQRETSNFLQEPAKRLGNGVQ